jgi:hypothetical protein
MLCKDEPRELFCLFGTSFASPIEPGTPKRLQLGMMAAVVGKHSGRLFWRGDAQVADDAAMHGVRVVEIDRLWASHEPIF